MLNYKKEFLAGLIIATISTAAVTHLSSLYAVEKKYSSEVEFSQRIGLFDSELLSEKTLQSNIAEIAFYRGLNLILVDKGIVKSFNSNNLEPLGITNTTAPMSSITRQKAAETVLRALMHAQNNGMIKVPSNSKVRSFTDYVPEEKYKDILSYAIENNILKGTGKNLFKPNKKLTVREALCFLRNLYEFDSVTANQKVANYEATSKTSVVEAPKSVTTKTKTIYIEPELKKFFKDISPTNTMANTIKKLINAGAFDKTDLNHELSLPKSFNVNDYSLICKGLLEKAGKSDLIKKIESLENSVFPDESVTRNMAVQMGSVLVDAYPHKEYNVKLNYKDVSPKSSVGVALNNLAKAGIKMGYSDSSLRGEERVSRFEALNLLGIIVGDNVGSKIKIQTIEEPVVQNEIVIQNEKPVETQKVKKQQSAKKVINKNINYKDPAVASVIEKQINKEYEGLSFLERIELRKNQFKKILNKETTR